MPYLLQVISVAFISIFVENTIFTRALGTSTLIIVSRNRKNIFGFGLCVTYITSVTGAICYFVNKYFVNEEMKYLYLPLIYIVSIGLVYIVTLLLLWKFMFKVFGEMRKYIHISAFNCAVFGAMFLSTKYCATLLEYIIHGFGIGLGFVFAVYIVAIVYDRIYSEDVPYCFRGYPLVLIYIGILSMAFYALLGHQLTF